MLFIDAAQMRAYGFDPQDNCSLGKFMTLSQRRAAAQPGTPPKLSLYGDWAELRLNRPDVHNRLEPDDIKVLRAHIETLNSDPALRVVVLTGDGSRTFCSGFHLGAFKASNWKPDLEFEDMVDAVESMRALTIARVNGSIYGGASDFALACDFRIGVHGSTMVVPAADLGLHFYGHGLRRWVSRIGIDVTKQVFLAGKALSADELLHCRFYTHIVAPDLLDTACLDLVARLRSVAPIAVQGMKQVINAAAAGEYDHTLATRQHLESLSTDDFVEGRVAFIEDRTPVFKAR